MAAYVTRITDINGNYLRIHVDINDNAKESFKSFSGGTERQDLARACAWARKTTKLPLIHRERVRRYRNKQINQPAGQHRKINRPGRPFGPRKRAEQVNGCTIVPGPGRCKDDAWACPGYQACLDVVHTKGWPGWARKGCNP